MSAGDVFDDMQPLPILHAAVLVEVLPKLEADERVGQLDAIAVLYVVIAAVDATARLLEEVQTT